MRPFVCTPLGALCALTLLGLCPLRRPQAQAQRSAPLNASAAPTALADTLRQLLPVGRMHAEVMRLVPTARLEELTRKLMDSARSHPQWFAQAVSKAGPGQPVAYHPNSGLTRAEYREFLHLAPAGMQLKKALDATLIVRQEGNRRLLAIEPASPQCSGLEMDLDALTVKTPFGLLKQHHTVDTRSDLRQNNRFVGTEWTLEEGSAPALAPASRGVTIVYCLVGRMLQPGQGTLLYRVTQQQPGQPPLNLQLILHYDLAPVHNMP